ncbi:MULTISPECIES: glycosyltransferase family 2 protein [Mycolicibacterium]|uniref:glycosyltransferase family 2 protein n=1 Tax=Mycolicibacterium TaxID=1866885 RepID=UPI0009290EE1|nr:MULTISPECIES: glycosyltransferase [Mycolicibacterium]RUP33597.1 MAG: glycosyltransferase [Mycolicibacterium sp.]UCZ61471.1 glycosyltransferase [Mycolicibacterium phocaicum]SHT84672.1 glycosyl transferase family protein [Mycobacteroides abscessus subsp. abscessus]
MISVVIPCRDGAGVLAKQLDAVLAQETSTEFEIVVADNGSTDGTADLVRSYRDPRVRLVDAGRAPGANVARNVGIAASKGDFILLTDADDVVHNGWIEAYHRAFMGGAQAVGGGLDRILGDGTLLAQERRLYPALARKDVFANGTNCGFTRELFSRVHGFDESFKGGADEVDFFWRAAEAGFMLEFVPDAVVSKVQRTDLKAAFRQYRNFGRGEARMLDKFRPWWLGPAAVGAAFQSIVWGLAWLSGVARRKTTCALGWNLGALQEAVQLLRVRAVGRV